MYLIAYDIESDKIRTKIAKYLEKKGLRIQKSVFAVEVTSKAVSHIMKDLEKLRKDDGVIHLFSVCRTCVGKSMVIGKGVPDPFYYFD
ncbi:MAG: CRISPR-associated endonuclease Cas2 [Candidatus Cloacimonetes bacterium]|nr:CRISPR-associated endonuclease Cas2 [Candidatus Cloacimonadota bacterium]